MPPASGELPNTQRSTKRLKPSPLFRIALTLIAFTVLVVGTNVFTPQSVRAEPQGEAVESAEPVAESAEEPVTEDVTQLMVTPRAGLTIANVTIVDTITADGRYTLQCQIGSSTYQGAEAAQLLVDNGYTVGWSDSDSNSYGPGYKVVVAGAAETVVETNGGWINVAYVKGAQKTFTVTISKGTTVAQASKKVSLYDELLNGSYESGSSSWSTTATDGKFEISDAANLKNTYINSHDPDQSAADQTHYAELNANQASALYQDVLTVPGVSMNWKFSHRARTKTSDGGSDSGAYDVNQAVNLSDKMAMIIAPVELVQSITTQDQLVIFYKNYLGLATDQPFDGTKTVVGDGTYGTLGTEYSVYVCYDAAAITKGSYTTGWGPWQQTVDFPQSAWQTREGTFAVPSEQYYTRFFFMALDSAYDHLTSAQAGLKYTVGNLLDSVWFSQDQPPAAKDEAKLIVKKEVSGLEEADAYELLNKTGLISAAIGDGTASALALESISGSDGTYTATYTTVTQKGLITGSSASFTATEDTDAADVEGYSRETTADNNEGATKTVAVPAGSTTTITFKNTYTKKTVTLGEDQIGATKTLKGRNSNDGESFTVQIAAGSYTNVGGDADTDVDVPMPESTQLSFTNLNDGVQSDVEHFGEITYSTPGTYTYTLAESQENASSDLDYSTATYAGTVTVTQNDDNTLGAEAVITNAGGTIVDVADFTNTVKTYGLQILKQDSSEKGLQGAEFQLLDADRNVVDTSTPSDGDGLAYFTGLKPGTYALKESHVPAGYQILTGTYTLQISSDGTATLTSDDAGHVQDGALGTVVRPGSDDAATFTMTITNSSIVDLPQTGGVGNVPLYVAGAALVAGAVVLADRRRREA